MKTTFKINYEINDNAKLKGEFIFDKKSNTVLISENDIETILSELTALIIDLKKKHKIYQFSFNINLIDENDTSKVLFIDEKALFNEVRKYNTLSSATIKYLKVTDDGEYDSRIWEDCENPLGTEAILSLVSKDKKWMPEYINFLRTCDLDHEVNQGGDMEELIEQYGWNKETCSLAIARLITCCGQHGSEQFEDLLENGLSDYIQENKLLFLEKLMEEFKYALDSDSCYSPSLNGLKEDYLNEFFEYIEALNNILDKNDFDKINIYLSNYWDAFNNKK
ncbi:hypothetical protein PG913_02855 [Tenacibaculum pacificus]|uniref:hypothetical protein n=1 Tax=Tenacibaculum pacificus TaxID=3018314 RepID=UPI0022F3B292|nr:hypothetical protein [Tenacibaculum pacificus]WBX74179.1 hypothetical protein PG913_02855 [Tenacibaculum pacificus]